LSLTGTSSQIHYH